MPIQMNLDAQFTLRSIFGAHFFLTSIVLLGMWPGDSYLFYNGLILALLIWAQIAPPVDSELALLKCLAAEGLAIILDILVMSIRYRALWLSGLDTFALIICIIQFFGRFAACFVLFRIREERLSLNYGTASGGSATIGGGIGTIGGQGGYEEFPPSYGAGAPVGMAGHDTRPLPP